MTGRACDGAATGSPQILNRTNGTSGMMPIIVIDTREQLNYTFSAIRADSREGGGILTVPTRIATLPSGDYSLEGYEALIAVERKSKADAFSTIGTANRERFVRELERLAEYQFAAVVVEAEWSEIVSNPPSHTQVQPKTLLRSVLAWEQRYPRVHWHFVPGRDAGEVMTYRILERFWRERQEELKQAGEKIAEVGVGGGDQANAAARKRNKLREQQLAGAVKQHVKRGGS